MALSLDGGVSIRGTSGTSAVTPTLTCANAGNVIKVAVEANGASVTSVTGGGVTFTRRSIVGSTNVTELWEGYASGTFNAAVTVNFSASASFATVVAFGISGAPSSNYNDTNASLPSTEEGDAVDPAVLSTTAADTFIISIWRMGNTPTPTPGSGWTAVATLTNGYFMVAYRVVTSAQTNLTCDIGTGAGDGDHFIGDAVVQAGGGGGGGGTPAFRMSLLGVGR